MREELKKEREGEYGGNWRDSKGRDGKKRRLRYRYNLYLSTKQFISNYIN